MTTPDWIFKMTTREWRRFNVYYDELKGCLFANGIISGLPKEGLEVIDLAAYEELQHKFYDCDRARSKLSIVFDEIQKERDALKAEVVGLKQMFESLNKHVLSGEVDSVDSARRVLSEIKQLRTHNEALKSTLVGINLGGERISKRLALRERQLERAKEVLLNYPQEWCVVINSVGGLTTQIPSAASEALKDIEEMGK